MTNNKDDLKFTLALIICFVVGIAMVVMSANEYNNKKDIITVDFSGGFELIDIEHTVFLGLIPTGTDHYFLCFDDLDLAYVVKASSGWYEDNFSSDSGTARNRVTVTGLPKKHSDVYNRDAIRDELQAVEAEGYEIKYAQSYDYYLDKDYKSSALYGIFVGGFFVILGIVFVVVMFKKRNTY